MRLVLTFLAWLLTLIGFIGVVVPLLPSTPFFLLALYLFNRTSPQFAQWLRQNRFSGPTLVAWEKHRIIRPRAKLLATLFVLSSCGYVIFFANRPTWVKAVVGAISTGVLTFLLTRPSREKNLGA